MNQEERCTDINCEQTTCENCTEGAGDTTYALPGVTETLRQEDGTEIQPDGTEAEYTIGAEVDIRNVPLGKVEDMRSHILEVLKSGQAVIIKAFNGHPERRLFMTQEGKIHEMIINNKTKIHTFKPHQGAKEIARRKKQMERQQAKYARGQQPHYVHVEESPLVAVQEQSSTEVTL